MTTNAGGQTVDRYARKPQKARRPKRELRDFRTHSVLQSVGEVVFWTFVIGFPLAVFLHPVFGIAAAFVVSYFVAIKNLSAISVDKESIRVRFKAQKTETVVLLKHIAAVDCQLCVPGAGMLEGCKDGEGKVTIIMDTGEFIELPRMLRAEQLCDVIIKRRDWKPDHRYRGAAK